MERYRRRKAEVELLRRLSEVRHLSRTAEVGGAIRILCPRAELSSLLSVGLKAEAAETFIRPDTPEAGKLKEILGNIRHANGLAVDIIQHLGRLLKRRGAARC